MYQQIEEKMINPRNSNYKDKRINPDVTEPPKRSIANKEDFAYQEHPLPVNVEAENGVLGALLIDRDAIAKVASLLTSQDFFSLERANLFRALCALYASGEPADIVTVRDQLKKMELLGETEGKISPGLILKLINSTPSAVHISYYAEIVRRYSALRRILGVGVKITSAAFKPEALPGDLLNLLSNELQNLANWWRRGLEQDYFLRHEATTDRLHLIDRAIKEKSESWTSDTILESEKDEETKAEKVRLRFGFSCLDGREPSSPLSFDGEEPSMLLLHSTLTAIMADTSVGKTILAEQISEVNAMQGANILFFHNELSHEQMLWRRNCRLTGVPVWKQVEPQYLSDREIELLVTASAKVYSWPGRIDYAFCPDWSAKEIAQEARLRNLALLSGIGRGYDLVVTDYLQNMGVGEGRETRAEKVSQNVHTLHNLANELKVAVLFTSQLTRDASREEGFIKPTLHGGLESGSIERHSNQVLGLWRENQAHPTTPGITKAELACLKSTFGRRGWVKPLQFIENRLEYVE